MAAFELSKGFFQKFHEGTITQGCQPVLQIIEARSLTGPQSSYRVRLSDSVFSYSACGVSNALRDRFSTDGLTEHNAVIRVKEYKTNEGQKRSLTIFDYELIDLYSPVIGNPVSHSGKADDYRGIQNMNLNNKAVKRPVSPDGGDDRQPLRKRNPSENVKGLEKTEIALITPYINKWRICGIVSGKENLKVIQNARGEFKVFSFIVTDHDGNGIRVSAFGQEAEKFCNIVQDNQTFYVSGGGGGTVKPSNKKYNATGHDYELTLNRESEVVPCDLQMQQPKFKMNAVPLSRVIEHIDECIDVLAVVDRISDLTQVTTRAKQEQLDKRDIFLIDETASEITFTLWGEKARDFDLECIRQVIAIKGANVKEFNGGVSLSLTSGGSVNFNPDSDPSHRLDSWYLSVRPTLEVKPLSSTFGDSSTLFERDLRLIGVSVQNHLGRDSDKGIFFNVKAMINSIKSENAIYQGCVTEGCKKKVISEGNQYRCEKCNMSFANFKNILMLQVEIADFSGTAWATIFDEKAVPLLGESADNLAQLRREDISIYDAVFEKIRFRDFNIRVKVSYSMYNDQQQMKWQVMDIKPVPYDKCKKIFNEAIQKSDELMI